MVVELLVTVVLAAVVVLVVVVVVVSLVVVVEDGLVCDLLGKVGVVVVVDRSVSTGRLLNNKFEKMQLDVQ